LCHLSIGPWHSDLIDFIAQLPARPIDTYKKVRTGECFVPLDQQSLIIDYFDELAASVGRAPDAMDIVDLRDACVLIVSHQHGLRPGQIARIKATDVRFHDTGAVHFSVVLLKQRRGAALRRVTRRVKRDWCGVFAEFDRRRSSLKTPPDAAADAYLGLTPSGVSRVISALTERLTGERWNPTELRHTAAQRQADAGAAHIVLSEFMGHASTRTANVYFDTSPTQAQRVNQALALSPIYSALAEAARTKTIDKAALLRLPAEQQVAGVPHGIPIAGIGGCTVGQPACVKNPVLSCYTCRKFMPIRDAGVHREVVDSLRPIVIEFAQASRGNEESPAYTQLRRTLTAALQVAKDIAEEPGVRGS
jgi:site-specific recombinase XerD